MVYSRNANEAMLPASNMKLITTAAAMKYLGPGYEFKTEVGLCGNTLVIKGGGDPLLGDKVTDAKYQRKPGWVFKDISEKLKQNGIKAIKDIIVDSSIFDDERVHPNWPRDQLNRWYACEVSGLNYNDNCIAITVKNTNGHITVGIEPKTRFVKIINKIKPIHKGNGGSGAYRNQKPNVITLKGKCKKQQGFDYAIENPAKFFGFLLKEHLARAGIETNGKILEEPVNYNYRKIAEYKTPITDCLDRCNKNSLGLAAEALVKTIAAKTISGGGRWALGRELIHSYLLELGIEEKEFHVDDGSGLSRKNRLSADAITKVLLDVHKGRNWELYKNSLAVGGVEGTIRSPFKEKKYRGKVFGKTGYIAGVKSFSGICSGRDGEYIFSILANNAKGKTREAINDIAKAIIDEN